jgi:hypothetical protein
MKTTKPPVVIAHRVFAHENFDKAAQTLLRLLHGAQLQSPDAERVLYLDIDGYKNSNGGFDDDMYELQAKFMAEILMKFLTRVETPLDAYRNSMPKDNNIPEALNLIRVDGSQRA